MLNNNNDEQTINLEDLGMNTPQPDSESYTDINITQSQRRKSKRNTADQEYAAIISGKTKTLHNTDQDEQTE